MTEREKKIGRAIGRANAIRSIIRDWPNAEWPNDLIETRSFDRVRDDVVAILVDLTKALEGTP